jgi:hypothetical protein
MRLAPLMLVTTLLARALADPTEEPEPEPSPQTKIIAAASVGAIHLAYATWSYFAWYRDADTNEFFVADEPLFAEATYAGGADKLGHMWSNYALTRGTTAVLTAAGWPRLQSSIASALLTEVAFTLTEVQDGFYMYGFESHDMVANIAGAGLGVLMENVPAVDRLFDFRVEYFPSRDYRRSFRQTGSIDIGQDYSGQSFIIALHLGAIPPLGETEWTYWSRFLDLAVGFEAKHYAPIPEPRDALPQQTLYFGLAFNIQGILGELLPPSTGRRIARGAFEVYSPPYTTLRFGEAARVWESPP